MQSLIWSSVSVWTLKRRFYQEITAKVGVRQHPTLQNTTGDHAHVLHPSPFWQKA